MRAFAIAAHTRRAAGNALGVLDVRRHDVAAVPLVLDELEGITGGQRQQGSMVNREDLILEVVVLFQRIDLDLQGLQRTVAPACLSQRTWGRLQRFASRA